MEQQTLFGLIWQGLCKHCPQCGSGGIFHHWNKLKTVCPNCNCILAAREGNAWFFMYMTTAFITGWFVLYMFLFPSENTIFARVNLLVLALLAIVCTLPNRKGVAIALDYYMEAQEQKH